MTDMMERLQETRAFLQSWGGAPADCAVVLGSGYAYLVRELEGAEQLSYGDVPHFPRTTNPAHPGKLWKGTLFGKRVVMMQGRLHAYEGYAPAEMVYGVRSLGLWGVPRFVLTNAAGAIDPSYKIGEFMAISDHINFQGQNPLVGRNLEALGTRFPDMSDTYERVLRQDVLAAMRRAGVPLHEGVYGAMLGPSYETPAEIRMLRVVGAHAVGMSTVQEAIALRHMGKQIFGLSCLCNLAAGLSREDLRDEDIVQVFDRADVQSWARSILQGVLHAGH